MPINPCLCYTTWNWNLNQVLVQDRGPRHKLAHAIIASIITLFQTSHSANLWSCLNCIFWDKTILGLLSRVRGGWDDYETPLAWDMPRRISRRHSAVALAGGCALENSNEAVFFYKFNHKRDRNLVSNTTENVKKERAETWYVGTSINSQSGNQKIREFYSCQHTALPLHTW